MGTYESVIALGHRLGLGLLAFLGVGRLAPFQGLTFASRLTPESLRSPSGSLFCCSGTYSSVFRWQFVMPVPAAASETRVCRVRDEPFCSSRRTDARSSPRDAGQHRERMTMADAASALPSCGVCRSSMGGTGGGVGSRPRFGPGRPCSESAADDAPAGRPQPLAPLWTGIERDSA
ncbi:hypothetical protein DFJ74DRAFT_430756 [Hyaloraphidium curvatum]|nr:hypothetical protein DFJ74DRAFT_430756 [Hyaloraphidium curvatum]